VRFSRLIVRIGVVLCCFVILAARCATADTPSQTDSLQPCAACGDADGNGHCDISDVVFINAYLEGGPLVPSSCGNADGYGGINAADALYLISYVFQGGPLPRNCDDPQPNRYEYNGTIKIGCQPFEYDPIDSAFKIPIQLSIVPNPIGYCLGFRFDTSKVATFVWHNDDEWHTWRPSGQDLLLYGRQLPAYHDGPYDNEAIEILRVRLTTDGLSRPFYLDSIFYPPVSEFVFYGNDGLIYRPKFIPSGPCCDQCGDADSDHYYGLADAVFLIQHIFAGGPVPGDCLYTQGKGDANGDGAIEISDAVYLISYIYSHGPRPHCRGW
jgi:hypothetical protein